MHHEQKSLADLGFRMPAEWEPQQAVILSWPHNRDTWPGKFEPVFKVYVNIIREITDHEDVWLNVNSHQMETEARRLLTLGGVNLRRIRFFHLPTNDAWARDYGPICLVRQRNGRKERIITDWIFNGWGGKYYQTGYPQDDAIPKKIAQLTRIGYKEIPFILEGGSIDVNGQGALITSESCLLNQNRNENFTRNRIEELLCGHLGIKKIIWVSKGIAGDDTDGHIDDTVRFVGETTVVCAFEEDVSDDNHAALKAVFQSLLTAADQDARPLRVVKLPMPPRVEFNGERLPASYANFLITNGKVLVPTYRDARRDGLALSILQELFPGRRIVGIDCTDLVLGLGAIHCISQQVPAL